MRTFCQSVNLELSIESDQAERLPQIGLGHKFGYKELKDTKQGQEGVRGSISPLYI